jgi:hypothetical protein
MDANLYSISDAIEISVTTIALLASIPNILRRRRTKRDLQQDVSDAELTSLSLWMRVLDGEDRSRGGKVS